MTDHHQFPAPTANSNSMAAGAGVSFGLYQQVTRVSPNCSAPLTSSRRMPLRSLLLRCLRPMSPKPRIRSTPRPRPSLRRSACLKACFTPPRRRAPRIPPSPRRQEYLRRRPVPPPQPTAPTGSAAPGFFQTTGPWIAGNLYTVIPSAPLSPVADHGEKWFSVTRGKYVGLTKNSAISLNAVTGVSTGLMEKFSTQTDAINNFNAALHSGVVAIL
ncbi:hypothetical protein B0H13DRAFT_1935698 [Mycena leptocephala]|nr:hypothetical protein B0H13DRAFT_1935698 [Mycena leptocephala]